MSDDELDQLLKARLPRHAAPAALTERLRAQVAGGRATPAPRRRTRAWLWPTVSAVMAAMVVLLAVRVTRPGFAQRDTLVDELVHDHLRVVASTHPVEIESGGIHQVRPWFTGKLDFAPPVAFSGDDEFPLRGGSIGYVGDRRAALFLFGRRLHSVSLLVFPADGLTLPARPTMTARGFHVLAWREGGLGFALVSDVSLEDLEALKAKLKS